MTKKKPEALTIPTETDETPQTRSVSGADVYARLKAATSADADLIADAEHYVSVAGPDDRIARNVASELKRVKGLK